MTHVICLFGASCSGKSTLGYALKDNLGDQWTYVDRDDLIEHGLCSESAANDAIEEKIRLIKDRVIVDAQIPWREKSRGELYFAVLPPLETLLERDDIRAIRLQRSAMKAHYAREYVIETHQILSGIEKTKFDYCFDSSRMSVQEEIEVIKSYLWKP